MLKKQKGTFIGRLYIFFRSPWGFASTPCVIQKKDTCLKIFVCTCTLLGVTFGEDGAACWTAVDSVEVTSSTRKKIVEVSWNIFKHWTNRSVALSSCGSRSHHASVKIGCHASQSLEHFSHDEPSIIALFSMSFDDFQPPNQEVENIDGMTAIDGKKKSCTLYIK